VIRERVPDTTDPARVHPDLTVHQNEMIRLKDAFRCCGGVSLLTKIAFQKMAGRPLRRQRMANPPRKATGLPLADHPLHFGDRP
jgi:hypothetical protein